MKHTVLIFLFIPIFAISQIQYKTVNSKSLQEKREVKIQLPRNYEANKDKAYPVIFVLDGDYLFEPVAGNVDYYSYWDEMPEAIVVGINQNGSRQNDVMYSSEDFLPRDHSADFFEFVGGELLPLIDKNYRTKKFDIIMGHDLTANFINYYLFKEKPLFKGYVNISPDYAPKMQSRIKNTLAGSTERLWYYLATGENDIKELKSDIVSLNSKLETIDNNNLHYKFDNFDNSTHYSLVGKAIPNALESMFSTYRPIEKNEIDELVEAEESPFAFLEEKYNIIENLYGLKMKIRIHDYMVIASAIEKTKKWDDYKALAKRAKNDHPKTLMALYFEGRYLEENGKMKKALNKFQKAYGLKSVPGKSTDEVLDRVEQLKIDLKR